MTVSPFAGIPYRSELGVMPLYDTREYLNTSAVEHAATAPILLCPSQRMAILRSLVRGAREAIEGLSTILVRLCGPDYQIQLPTDLLAPDVLLTHDPELLVPVLTRSRRSGILTLWQALRTDGIDRGDNELTLTVYGEQCIPSFLRFAENDVVLSSLDGRTATQWGVGADPVAAELTAAPV
jgi:hypothetical protein